MFRSFVKFYPSFVIVTCFVNPVCRIREPEFVNKYKGGNCEQSVLHVRAHSVIINRYQSMSNYHIIVVQSLGEHELIAK